MIPNRHWYRAPILRGLFGFCLLGSLAGLRGQAASGPSSAPALEVPNLTDEWYLKRGVNRNIIWAGSERLIKLRIAYLF